MPAPGTTYCKSPNYPVKSQIQVVVLITKMSHHKLIPEVVMTGTDVTGSFYKYIAEVGVPIC
jgi:hypothetical protein